VFGSSDHVVPSTGDQHAFKPTFFTLLMIRSRVGKERASSSPHFGTETTPAESLANVGLQLGVFLILNINNDDIRASLSKWNADFRDVVDSPADLLVRVRATVTFLGNELLTRLYSYKYPSQF
jgi:hypothetical protein